MEIIYLRDEFIKLGQALKAAGFVDSGVEAKEVIQEGLVARSSYILRFTVWKMNDCPSSYLFCNLQDIVPKLYCHYNILS